MSIHDVSVATSFAVGVLATDAEEALMLVELSVVEQRLAAVKDVLENGATVTDVARRNKVARQTVHDWLRRSASDGLGGLIDKSSKPDNCPHQMSCEVEAQVLQLRRSHPGWGPRTIADQLARSGVDPVPGRSSIQRRRRSRRGHRSTMSPCRQCRVVACARRDAFTINAW